jgi:sulfide:quinone oxidoreductase
MAVGSARHSRPRVAVVGAGPGGLAAAARLRDRGEGKLEVALLSRHARATFLAGTLDVALGRAEPERFATRVALAGVRCLAAEVEEVGEDGVVADGERLAADAVIAAPGLALGTLPAWPRAVGAWDPAGAARARAAMPQVRAGKLVIAACSVPYRCPPAPFALAVGLAEAQRRAHRMVGVTVCTPEQMPLAGVGGEAPALVLEACAAAGVQIERGFALDLARSEDGVLCAADGRRLRYDAAFVVPPHERARCLRALPGTGPLVGVGAHGCVEGSTLYVIGDAAAGPLPRAAGIASGQGVQAADAVLEALGIRQAPKPAPLRASCFMFHYGGALSRVSVEVDGERRTVSLDGPSLDLAPAREGERRRFLAAAGGPVGGSAAL